MGQLSCLDYIINMQIVLAAFVLDFWVFLVFLFCAQQHMQYKTLVHYYIEKLLEIKQISIGSSIYHLIVV